MCLITPCAGGKDRRALGAGRDPSHLPAIHAAPARHSTRQSRAGLVTRKLWRQGTGSAVSPSVATRAPVRARNASRSTTSNSKRSSGTFCGAEPERRAAGNRQSAALDSCSGHYRRPGYSGRPSARPTKRSISGARTPTFNVCSLFPDGARRLTKVFHALV
jgi:hypothetical protein